MDETKIGMKIEAETKDLKSMCETMQTALKEQFAKGIKNVDTAEMYKAVDIFKDLTEAKKNVVEACYKSYILEAMEKFEVEEDGEDGDEEKRFYRGRSATTGRYVSRGRGGRKGYGEQHPYMDFLERYPREYYRNMDVTGGKMYYSDGDNADGGSESTRSYNDGYNRGYEDGMNNRSESRVERTRRGYHEAQAMHSKDSQEGKDKRLSELNKYMDELADDMKGLIKDMSNEERTMLKTKITKLGNLIQ